jgi:hypothetical protein
MSLPYSTIVDKTQHQNIDYNTQKPKAWEKYKERKKERKLMIEESEMTLEKKNKM